MSTASLNARDSMVTGIVAGGVYLAGRYLMAGGSLDQQMLDGFAVAGAAGMGEFLSDMAVPVVGGSNSDPGRMARTAAAALAPAAWCYYADGAQQSLTAAAAGVAGHVASQYYFYNDFYL
jgi:hypothetical protein